MDVLLDTNILIGLLQDATEDEKLDQLILGVSENQLRILLPDSLNQEWKSKRILTINKIESSLKSTSTFSDNELFDIFIQSEIEKLKIKTSKLDNLLSRSVNIKTSRKVKADTIDRLNSRKAPFHKRTNSITDSQLYFSTIEFLEKKGINEFVFVT